MNISVFGLGYVGCVSVGCLAATGHQVIGVDINDHKINLINKGKPTIIEKDIDLLIAEYRSKGTISATVDFENAVVQTEVSIISVGTPATPEGHVRMDAVYETARQIGESLKKKEEFHIVVIRSTVPLGTNQEVGSIIANASGKVRNRDFAVISNPEFLREGSSVHDFFYPPMTVIGSDHEEAAKRIAEMYASIQAPVEETTIEEAELIKYVNNSFHALKITFANEVGNICKKMAIDSHRLMELFCLDRQLNLSPYYLKPGFAYGGSCLPKDLKALQTMAHDFYLDSPVLHAISLSNENQKKIAFDMVMELGKDDIGILGLSFKKGTDDLRYSPMVDLAESLLGKGKRLRIYDGNLNLSMLSGTNKAYIDDHIPHLAEVMEDDADTVVSDSEVIVVAHNESEYKEIFKRYPEKIFIDLIKVIPGISTANYRGICW